MYELDSTIDYGAVLAKIQKIEHQSQELAKARLSQEGREHLEDTLGGILNTEQSEKLSEIESSLPDFTPYKREVAKMLLRTSAVFTIENDGIHYDEKPEEIELFNKMKGVA